MTLSYVSPVTRVTALYIGLHATACQFFSLTRCRWFSLHSLSFCPAKISLPNCHHNFTMVGRGKKTTRKNLVKNPGFRREHDSSSESENEAPLAGGATDDIHRDEVLDLHDQLEQGELLEDRRQ